MNAEERHKLFEQLRYELRMAEGWADELNATKKSVTAPDCKVLVEKIRKAMATAEKLNEAFSPNVDVPF